MKWYRFFIVVCLFVLSAACTSRADAASEKALLKSAVARNLSGENKVQKVFYLDYDKNGRKEAFLLSGKEGKELWDDGTYTLWFGYCENGKARVRVVAKNIESTAHTLKLKSAAFFCAGSFCATSYPQTMYRVSGNTVKGIFRGDTLVKDRGDSFISIDSTYDAMKDDGMMLGHTWKPYYYYYKNGKVYKYKAKKISLRTLRKYRGASKYLQQIKKTKYQISSVYQRSNGLIHINLKHKTSDRSIEYENVTLIRKGKKVLLAVIDKKGKNIIAKSSYGGIYKK